MQNYPAILRGVVPGRPVTGTAGGRIADAAGAAGAGAGAGGRFAASTAAPMLLLLTGSVVPFRSSVSSRFRCTRKRAWRPAYFGSGNDAKRTGTSSSSSSSDEYLRIISWRMVTLHWGLFHRICPRCTFIYSIICISDVGWWPQFARDDINHDGHDGI